MIRGQSRIKKQLVNAVLQVRCLFIAAFKIHRPLAELHLGLTDIASILSEPSYLLRRQTHRQPQALQGLFPALPRGVTGFLELFETGLGTFAAPLGGQPGRVKWYQCF